MMIHYVGILQFVLALNVLVTVSRCCGYWHRGKTKSLPLTWLFRRRRRRCRRSSPTDRTADEASSSSASSSSSSSASSSSSMARRHRHLLYGRYLPVYLLAVSADWMQGPYKYSVYSAYGYTLHDISLLFVAGFGSGMSLGSIFGGWADTVGRKRCVLSYCVIYAASCLAKHFRPFPILLIGRVLGGIATSLLFSVFDAWLIRAHALRNIHDATNSGYSSSPSYLAKSFSAANYGSSVVAILAGLLAHAVVEGEGGSDNNHHNNSDGNDNTNAANPLRPAFASARRVWDAALLLSPNSSENESMLAVDDERWNAAIVYQGGGIRAFDVALIPLALCFILALVMWEENYGDDNKQQNDSQQRIMRNSAGIKKGNRVGMFTAIRMASWTVWRSPDIFNLCIVSSFFEGAMYVFILLWTPALRTLDNTFPGPPLGIVFATFMVCCMLGTSAFSILTFLGVSSSRILVCILLLSAFSCYIICKSADVLFSYSAMLLFEFCIGAYFPAMSTVKSSVVPENERAAVYNVFRLPLNLIVLLNLLTNLSFKQSFGICAMMLGVAAILQSRMVQWEKTSDNSSDEKSVHIELPVMLGPATEVFLERGLDSEEMNQILTTMKRQEALKRNLANARAYG